MKLIFTITLLTILLVSCHNNSKKKTTESSTSTSQINKVNSVNKSDLNSDSILIPTFKIKIELNENAEKKLKNLKESIIVQAYFSGEPKDTTSDEYFKTGKETIGTAKIELFDSRLAVFENIRIGKAAYEGLTDKNFEVLINVFTGRRVEENNLLSCDILLENIEDIKGKEHLLKGKLILDD